TPSTGRDTAQSRSRSRPIASSSAAPSPVTATTTPDFARIRAFDLGLRSRVAQRAPTPSGFALRFAEQAFWDLNFLYVERPAADVETLLAEADAALSGLGHRMLVIDEPPAPELLAADLGRRGWTVERHVAMA